MSGPAATSGGFTAKLLDELYRDDPEGGPST